MQRRHDRQVRGGKKVDDVTSGRTAEDAEFMLHQNEVGRAHAERTSGALKGGRVALVDRPAHMRRIIVRSLRRIVDGDHEGLHARLRSNGLVEVVRERCDSAQSRRERADNRNSQILTAADRHQLFLHSFRIVARTVAK